MWSVAEHAIIVNAGSRYYIKNIIVIDVDTDAGGDSRIYISGFAISVKITDSIFLNTTNAHVEYHNCSFIDMKTEALSRTTQHRGSPCEGYEQPWAK